MKRKLMLAALGSGALAIGSLAAGLPGASAMPVRTAPAATHAVHVCSAHPAPGTSSCLAMAVVQANGKVFNKSRPLVGFNSADIQKAYNLKGLKSHGATVAIVDAYGYPTLESDLKMFRSTNKLPACTTASGCLTVMNQNGGSKPPPANAGWDTEQALDLDMVSSACPDCKILIVQSDDNHNKNLGAAENQAASQKGVLAISNSWGGGSGPNSKNFNHPGIAITASTGDGGNQKYGLYPSADTHVVAVGGTSVFKDGSARGYNEAAWAGAGSGCSKVNPMPKYQKKVKTTCKTDATADVSGPADPNNGGLIIYYNGGWAQYGGTSESSPMIAAVYVLSGKTKGYPGGFPYADTKDLYDVTTGTNGSCGTVLCDAGKGWDGPTGLGTPNGVKAF